MRAEPSDRPAQTTETDAEAEAGADAEEDEEEEGEGTDASAVAKRGDTVARPDCTVCVRRRTPV